LEETVVEKEKRVIDESWKTLQWSPVVCTCLCVGGQEDSSYRVYRGLHLHICFLISQCLGLSDFPFLQKEGIQIENPWTQMQIKQLLAG